MLPPPSTHSQVDAPGTDLLSFVFDGCTDSHETKAAYIDAEDPSRTLSVRQTTTLVRKLIAGWKALGMTRGECVLLVLGNSILYSPIYFSIIGAGGVYIGVNPSSQTFELDHVLVLAQPKFIVASYDNLPGVIQATERYGISADRVLALDAKHFPLLPADGLPLSPPRSRNGSLSDAASESCPDFTHLISHGESDWIRFHDIETAKSTPAAMFSTSGTSGLPKAAISSHYALVSQHLSMESTPHYQISRLISLPFFHVFAALFAHVWPIRNSQPLHVLPRFQLQQFANAIRQFAITDTVLAPPIVHACNRSSLPLKELFDSIRWIGVGGAPIATEAMQQFETHLHHSATLSQVWGMTEIGVATLVSFPEQRCWGSIGRPLRGYEMRLMDSFGGLVTSDHEPGSLQVRYLGMMTGYKDQTPHPEGEWYDTGDIMTRVDGKYFVVGRSKELIKVNGWQVAPAELEAVLLSHPCISDVGVIGTLREDGLGEVPRAYVVRKSGTDGRCSTVSVEEIYEFARKRLASYKALDGGIFFVNDIPRTASGKIQRFKLGQMDQYRHSVTELLMRNNSVVAEQKRDNVADLKAQAEEVRTGRRRSTRHRSVKPNLQSETGPKKAPKPSHPKRRERTSLVDRMRALEASRLVLNDRTMVSPTG